LPAALVGASVALLLLVVAVSALIGGGPGVIPLAGRASATDQGRVLDKQTQAGQNGRAAPASSASGAFPAVVMEAEAAVLGGSAVKANYCDGCSGGMVVRFIGGAGADSGTVTFGGVKVPVTGTYHLTVGCVLGDAAHGPFLVSVDGGPPASVTCPVGGWSSVAPVTVAVTLQAGVSNTIAVGNSTMAAPDLDFVSVNP
jgi:hypothetical protein